MARIDDFLSHSHFESRHERRVVATPERALKAALEMDVSDSRIVRTLFRLRGLPKEALRLRDLTRLGFSQLAHDENREVVFGLVGQPWRLSGNLQQVPADHFSKFADPGFAKVAWNFYVSPLGEATTLMSTTTRILCTDERSRRRFSRYWTLVGPFSGLIRKIMLDSIARSAESDA